ncbi:hypothetical protein QN372_08440 [Undibacterium sp. RTI2.1]|uniref:hypothetical protein n=2 Tax=Pseudomonadota TaxID=1224 RepID=UPI002AB47028|nr:MULTISPECIES: hypothetical protein [unclassified Undibacterium]MDY7539752.1 hypothetical protein [Undibacterium sp. 5I1]MEB0030771.1 hypothetical protein [Undibacterium sp. RTI2.1]MEB0117110.1 hypothetical protein [Undibacterium sp. RTI2.2]MEB0233091.1 hypothetical protein [Undibacterium sp. 10I3]MEB0256787.1 hypothetical protein [Undibacterium sp. 5I1]
MKTSFKTPAIFSAALIAGVFAVGAAFQPVSSNANVNTQVAQAQIQTVTIVAKRMSADEKLAFDTQANGIQTVVISAKRLSPEQKLIMAQEDQALQHGVAIKAVRLAQNNG